MMRLCGADAKMAVLNCECGSTTFLDINDFKEVTDNYVIPNDDVKISCWKCGKEHTESVIVKRSEPSRPAVNLPRCPTCGSHLIEKIATFDKAVGAAVMGVFSKNFGKTFHCKQCGYRW